MITSNYNCVRHATTLFEETIVYKSICAQLQICRKLQIHLRIEIRQTSRNRRVPKVKIHLYEDLEFKEKQRFLEFEESN